MQGSTVNRSLVYGPWYHAVSIVLLFFYMKDFFLNYRLIHCNA